ncbi:hypothetical protein CBW16_09570 [Flavobacteriaceae bacterium JJC]|uniref:hypothetical protein n=1 Tax=Kaistella soli TaxID=2849654 RepID=UPI000B4AF86A|nr:hypothetical protein [Kaistella soli]MBU8882963.1 hypothetical protein [Kaistella soli]OWK73735.1 hypothetical protein CBW16_09570 [Flavobacteriaceae bacterium JJC]
MNYTIVGLFPSQENAKEVSEGLEQSGIRNEDYIIYKTNRNSSAEQKQNFWKKLLGLQPENAQQEDKLITSVSVRNEEELTSVKKSFRKNDVVKMYEFQDMTLEEAKDLEYIKKIVALRAKSHIYAMPEISVSKGNIQQGMNAEIKA